MYIKNVFLLLLLAYFTFGQAESVRRTRCEGEDADATKVEDVRKIRRQYEPQHLVHKKHTKLNKHDNGLNKNGTTTQETKQVDEKQEKKSEGNKVQERVKLEETKTNNNVTEKSDMVATSAAPKTLHSAFKDSKIIPDVFFIGPEKTLDVTYASDKEVKLGNELTPKQVINPPTVKYEAEKDSFYTLIMSDPDAPSRKNPKAREWHHWLVVNIPGSDVSKGDTLSQYIGAAPPQASGLHRYVFLLFKQPEKLKFHETIHHANDGNRAKFNTQEFSKKYNLGSPVAGNFFQAQWDDSVPATHKRLGFK